MLFVALAFAILTAFETSSGAPGLHFLDEAHFSGEESSAGALHSNSSSQIRGVTEGALPPGQKALSYRPQQTSAPLNAAATPTATPAIPASVCQPVHPAYCVYTVKPGDTLSQIAQRFGLSNAEVSGAELLVASNKPDIVSIDDFIQPEQKLRIPTRRGVVQTVILGETVGDLAVFYDVTSVEIIGANNLGNGNLLQIGQTLLIPNPKRIAPPAAESPAAAVPPAPAPEPFAFVWPLRTIRISNYMSARHPLGIDLGLASDPRAPITAVEGGTVSFAGGDSCCSYGLYVIVDHGDGLKTLYAHLSRITVGKGQAVSKGETLGIAGSTGYSTGVHLHFEVHKDGKRVNPMLYLP